MGKQLLHIVAGLYRPGNAVLHAENFYDRQLKVAISHMKQLIKLFRRRHDIITLGRK